MLYKLVRASSLLKEDWEAGANPALPRNCKRGHRPGPLEIALGRSEAKLDGDGGATGVLVRQPSTSLLASQETGANCQHQPLSRVKEE
jgi:hypothetical protein